MGILTNIQDFVTALASIGKVMIMSRRPFARGKRQDSDELVILGNGPSLRHTIDSQLAEVMSRKRLAVNFAANAPEFSILKPDFYVLADGHFFTGAGSDPNVERLMKSLSATSWPMTIFVPCRMKKKLHAILRGNTNISVKGFNLTPAEGTACITHILYAAGLAMPRPRNVLIPSIMIGMRLGFNRIWLCGADHTWSRTLGVDDDNMVISVQPHFYKDTASEQKRVNSEYAGYHLHHILRSLYIAFRSYHMIAAYAATENVEILNATPGSMIDAFPRKKLTTL